MATSHGINEAFSTGSQNHQPPQPSSWYAHQLPKAIPNVKKDHAKTVQERTQRAHWGSSRLFTKATTAKAKGTDKPT